jgi:23S rRNA pseudouridine1911/1915/1917 synthase
MPLRIVYEDRDVLVVDKPAGLLTSTTPREKRATLLKMVREYVARREPRARIGLIHRLDRDASGLLVFSKNDLAYRSLKTQFFKHTVSRVYEAVVHGKPLPTKGRIESRLIEWRDGSVHSTKEHAKGQRAITDYELIEQMPGRAVLRVTLLTGRKHQIRAQLSERGWPIVGDHVYGDVNAKGPLMLKAMKLEFDHPRTGRRMTFKAL